MNTITDKNEAKKWEEVKKIQEDWISRSEQFRLSNDSKCSGYCGNMCWIFV